jgi:hypothetical protein
MMRRTSLLCQDIYLIPLDNYRDLRAKQSRITSVLKRDPATKIDLARPLAEECGLWNGNCLVRVGQLHPGIPLPALSALSALPAFPRGAIA